MNNLPTKFRISLATTLMAFVFIGSAQARFTDVPEGSSYDLATSYLNKSQVIKGYDDGTFKPKKTINRAEAVKVVLSLLGEDVVQDAKEQIFNDVPVDAWFAPYVAEAKNKGIIRGDRENFEPNRTVNRAEFLKMLTTAFALDVSNQKFTVPFLDAKESDWFYPYFQFFVIEKILEFSSTNEVHPGEFVTRGEAAAWSFGFLKSGKILRENVLLELSSQAVTETVDQLLAGDIKKAEAQRNLASEWIEVLKKQDPVEDVSTMDLIISALGTSVKSYQAILEKDKEGAIAEAKQTWATADKIKTESDISKTLKDFAGGMADFARENL